MKNKKAQAVLSSLALMSSALQGHADEQFQYTNLGTGQDIREGVVDEQSPENAPQGKTAKKGTVAQSKAGQDKCSKGNCGDDNDKSSKGKCSKSKCSKGGCGDDDDKSSKGKCSNGKCSKGGCGDDDDKSSKGKCSKDSCGNKNKHDRRSRKSNNTN